MTSFPTGLDSFTNPTATDQVSVISHSGQHSDANDAIEALEAKIGIDSSAVATSLDYLIKNTSSKLGAIASLAVTDSNIIVGNGTNWVAESGATARTSLGLGTTDSPTFAGATCLGSSPEFIIKGSATTSVPQLSWYENTSTLGAFMQYRGSGASSPKVLRLGTYISGGTVELISGDSGVAVVTIDANVNNTGVYKVDGVQVVGNRVIDARCDDTINSGDATTDGVIDALRDAMIAHGLLAAA